MKLENLPTHVDPYYKSKKRYQKILEGQVGRLSALQLQLYASNRYALLLVLQGMDAAGKDGVIKHIMSGVNPQGCSVFSFKQPSAEELEHDFLWRTTYRLPERGKIGIFNRSYYEEVIIVRVHPELLQKEGLIEKGGGDKFWNLRYESIVDQEKHLYLNGTRIIKIYLHLSQEEQRRRFLKRIEDPEKNWKFSLSDIQERQFWSQYQKAYEACLTETSHHEAPWYIVPADDKANARLIVSQIMLDTLEALDLGYPTVTKKRRKELNAIRETLTSSSMS